MVFHDKLTINYFKSLFERYLLANVLLDIINNTSEIFTSISGLLSIQFNGQRKMI